MTQVGEQRLGDPELRLDDVGDVGGGPADLLDRRGDLEHPLDRLGVLGAATGEHGHRAQAAVRVVHPVAEPLDLPRELLLVEEDRRVGQVDHQIGDVLRLDQEVLDRSRLLIHGFRPPIVTERTAGRSRRSGP